jgi:hypothetical protein
VYRLTPCIAEKTNPALVSISCNCVYENSESLITDDELVENQPIVQYLSQGIGAK